MPRLTSVCVFCGSSAGTNPRYREAARFLGRSLARRHVELVYGGGSVGIMGELSDATLAAGGRVTGIIPGSMSDEVGHHRLTELVVVDGMHERKALMYERADAFMALPGGFGTIDELAEILTWSQLGHHAKPVGAANVDGFFDGLLDFFDRAVADGLLKPHNRELLVTADDPVTLLDRLAETEVTYQPKWQ